MATIDDTVALHRNPDGGFVQVPLDIVTGVGVIIGDDVTFGRRVKLRDGARIGPSSSIGDDVMIGAGAVLGYDVTINQGASISPHCTIGDHANLGENVALGEGAHVSAWVTIPDGETVAPNVRVSLFDFSRS